MLARFAILVPFAEVMLCIFSLVQFCLTIGTAHHNRLHHAQCEFRSQNPQPNHRAFLQRHLRNPRFAHKYTVAAVQIAQPPLAILKKNAGMQPAHILVPDRELALIRTSDLEQRGKCVFLIRGAIHLHRKMDGTPQRVIVFFVFWRFGHGWPSTNIHYTPRKSTRIWPESEIACVAHPILVLSNLRDSCPE